MIYAKNIYKEKLNESQILEEVDRLFSDYVTNRNLHETFGDFAFRTLFAN